MCLRYSSRVKVKVKLIKSGCMACKVNLLHVLIEMVSIFAHWLPKTGK